MLKKIPRHRDDEGGQAIEKTISTFDRKIDVGIQPKKFKSRPGIRPSDTHTTQKIEGNATTPHKTVNYP